MDEISWEKEEKEPERNDLRKRVGRFKIDIDAFFQHWGDVTPLFKIFSRCIILRAEHMYYDRYIEYMALSPDFDLIEEGMLAPRYAWQYNSETEELKAVHDPDFEEQQRAKIEELEKENFALSAGVCEYLLGDEHGNPTCKPREELAELHRVIAQKIQEGAKKDETKKG